MTPDTEDNLAKHPVYPHAFRPLRIGNLNLRNRVFVPAHTTNFGDDNLPSKRHLAYHQARAAGGAALIIFEGIRVHRSSLGRRQGVNGYEAGSIKRFKPIADAVRDEGAALLGQIIHLGRHIDGNYTRTPAWGASPIPWTAMAPAPHPMTIAEIQQVVQAHALTAVHLMEAGLDGIELQMAHGHLLQQFMSPASNHRIDDYGGSLENRIRFAKQTLAAVREAVGDHTCLGIRISADEFMADGLGIDDMLHLTPRLISDTSVDFVNISHSAYHGSYTLATQMADMAFAPRTFAPLTERLNKVLQSSDQPPAVMTACQYRSVADAESMLAAGHADMIGMARAHIADPDIVNKAKAGREADTVPCIACNQGCAGMLAQSLAITCLTNPRAGMEHQWPALVTGRSPVGGTSRNILVIGGGPAGCEAAATAAALGHYVTLWECRDSLGGELKFAASIPLRAEIKHLLESQQHRLAQHGVKIELGTEAGRANVQALMPDAVIVATGASARAAQYPGGASVLALQQALRLPDTLGNDVVMVDVTGSWAFASTVEHLADLGKRVTVVVGVGVPAWSVNIYSSFAMRQRWKDKGVRIVANHTVHEYRKNTVVLTDTTTGESTFKLHASSLIAPLHGAPRDQLTNELLDWTRDQHMDMTVLAAGDCQSPRSALEAIYEGHEAARSITASFKEH